ncbi:MAG TPA: hypothetical protein VGI74_21095 [Streptosporangiaceae bacterium]
MHTWTNMTWSGDPYRTGQQLYPRPSPRLAAFTVDQATAGGQLAPAAVATVYLPLHRTRPLTVTDQTLTFGFHAVGTDDPAQVPGLAAVANLALMQARRHARILAGHQLAADLAALRQPDSAALRGLTAVGHDWAQRSAEPGRAVMFDCGLDLPGGPPLEHACQQAGIVIHAADPSRQAAVASVERALLIALVCARHLGHYNWTSTLHIKRVMASTTWDCLPWPQQGTPGSHTPQAGTPGQASAGSAVTPRSRQ